MLQFPIAKKICLLYGFFKSIVQSWNVTRNVLFCYIRNLTERVIYRNDGVDTTGLIIFLLLRHPVVNVPPLVRVAERVYLCGVLERHPLKVHHALGTAALLVVATAHIATAQ